MYRYVFSFFTFKQSLCLQIYNWVPEFYDDINDLPEEMPKDLVEYIKSINETQVHFLIDP